MNKLKNIIAICLACAIPNLSVYAFDLAQRETETTDLSAADFGETVPDLPLELQEPDVTKAERFIIKYKEKTTSSI